MSLKELNNIVDEMNEEIKSNEDYLYRKLDEQLNKQFGFDEIQEKHKEHMRIHGIFNASITSVTKYRDKLKSILNKEEINEK